MHNLFHEKTLVSILFLFFFFLKNTCLCQVVDDKFYDTIIVQTIHFDNICIEETFNRIKQIGGDDFDLYFVDFKEKAKVEYVDVKGIEKHSLHSDVFFREAKYAYVVNSAIFLIHENVNPCIVYNCDDSIPIYINDYIGHEKFSFCFGGVDFEMSFIIKDIILLDSLFSNKIQVSDWYKSTG